MLTNPFLLDVLDSYRADILVTELQRDHKSRRHASYKMFMFWWKGRLGQGKRKVIPSCVVMKIREIYPDPFNHYTGYKAHRLS